MLNQIFFIFAVLLIGACEKKSVNSVNLSFL